MVEPPFITDGRARVEQALLDAVRLDDDFLTDVSSHLILAGGKRTRPMFTLAAALAVDLRPEWASEASVLGGVACELVHLGSLYHDDVIDEAVTRRTVESVNARWGNLTAILAGDMLLAKASEIAASLGTEVAALLAATIGRLCEGEVIELRSAFDVERTEAAYIDSIRGKTAALFATSCRVGGLVADLDRGAVDALTRFGEAYGMAFQIVDDVLDVVATDEQLGKPAGHDLVEGVYTLPVLRALGTPAGRELRALLGRPLSEEDRSTARDLVRIDGAVPAAIDVASRYVEQAIDELAAFGPTPATDWLAGTARDLVEAVAGPATANH